MKTFLKLTVALFAFGFATANAQLSDAQKSIIAGVVATADEGRGNQEDTIEAVRVACKDNEDIAADIVSAVIIAIGGENADKDYVGKIVAAAIKGAPDKSEAIIAAALAAAPHATEQINTSATGGGGNNDLLRTGGGGTSAGGQSDGPPGGS